MSRGRDTAPNRITIAKQLGAYPDGSVYVSDAHPDTPETKARGVWWTAGGEPFEPELPGTIVYSPHLPERCTTVNSGIMCQAKQGHTGNHCAKTDIGRYLFRDSRSTLYIFDQT